MAPASPYASDSDDDNYDDMILSVESLAISMPDGHEGGSSSSSDDGIVAVNTPAGSDDEMDNVNDEGISDGFSEGVYKSEVLFDNTNVEDGDEGHLEEARDHEPRTCDDNGDLADAGREEAHRDKHIDKTGEIPAAKGADNVDAPDEKADSAELPNEKAGYTDKADGEARNNGDAENAGENPTERPADPREDPTLIQDFIAWAKEHPIQAAALGASTAAFVAPMAIALPVLGIIGFGSSGVVGASIAALWQSSIGNVAAGSLFAILQSAAAGGAVGSAVVGGTVGMGGATGAAGAARSFAEWRRQRHQGRRGASGQAG